MIAEGIERMRKGQLKVEPGYDGEFGTVKIFSSEERESKLAQDQLTLFK